MSLFVSASLACLIVNCPRGGKRGESPFLSMQGLVKEVSFINFNIYLMFISIWPIRVVVKDNLIFSSAKVVVQDIKASVLDQIFVVEQILDASLVPQKLINAEWKVFIQDHALLVLQCVVITMEDVLLMESVVLRVNLRNRDL